MDKPGHGIGLLGRITAPSEAIHVRYEWRQARFLAALLLVLPLVAVAGIAVQVLAQPALLGPALKNVPGIAFGLLGYWVARTRWWRAGIPLILVLVVVETVQATLVSPWNPIYFAYLVIPALLASVFLGRRGLVLVSALVLALALALGVVHLGALGPLGFLSGIIALVVLLCVVVLTSLHRWSVEEDRRHDLAAREALARGLLETSFGGLAVVRDGTIEEANRGFADIFGSRPPDLVGTPLDRVLPEAPPDSPGPHDGPRELLGRRVDGSFVPVAVVTRSEGVPAHDAHVVAVQDLSDREAQRARVHQADRLASMGQIAAGVAHEINNPLTWIVGNLERILPRVDGEARELVDQAIEGARRVRQITRDLDTFARAREGPVVGVDLVEIARSAVNMARHDIEHVAALEEVYGETPPVDGDPTRLGQVCLNLLVNAAHAVAEESEAHVRVEVGTTPGGEAFFEVCDDGPGIPTELQARVFEPSFADRENGTGLGLAISRSLVLDLGGEMRLESAPGEGTTIGFSMPPGHLPAPGASEPAAPAAEEARGAGELARILVIDDEPAICELVRAALSGHDVRIATTGEEGLHLALEEPWDVVLCDLMMPGVTGMEIHAALEAQAAGRERRLVFLTGGAFTPRARDFLDTVGNPVLQKPFRLAVVRETVSRALGVR